MSDFIGQTIHGYNFLQRIGEGGYGAVYKAHETNVDRDVAIKVILPEHTRKPEFTQRFENEARLVAQLEHPHIVPLYAYWHDEAGAFLVMRYVRGGSLKDVLKTQGALSLSQTARIFDQLTEALSTAHDAGVIHRDLKPDNILLDERGNVYLTDFGIAKQLDSDSNITGTNAIVGTFAYLSPEQVQGNPVTSQSDIYALGIILYELLSGEHPFAGTPPAMLVMKHLQESVPSVYAKRPDLPDEINDVIQKATNKDIEERYESATELMVAFRDAAALSSATPVAIPTTAERPSASQQIEHKTPATPEERNRRAMLQNVRTFWVEGVLENSLHGAALIELGMKEEADSVSHEWNTLLRRHDAPDETLPPGTKILDIFERLNGKLLILGDPGGGKTTTMLELTRDLLLRAEMDSEHPIPVVFNLSSWSEKRLPLTEWLAEELNSKYQVPRKVATEWAENDQMLLLLDGLDEVAIDARDGCVEAINAYREEHGFVDIVVCSRIIDYEALSNQLKLNGAIIIQPLNEQQVDDYLSSMGMEMDSIRSMLARDEQLRDLSRSPLMLSIMAMAYRGVSTETIPDFDDVEAQRGHLFRTYIQRMFDRRIGQKDYSQEETTHYLSWLAKQMSKHALSVFHIENLQFTWLPTQEEATQFPKTIRYILSVFLGTAWGIAAFFGVASIEMHPLFIPIWAMTGATYGYLFTHPIIFSGKQKYIQGIYLFIGCLAGIAYGLGMGLSEQSDKTIYTAIFGIVTYSTISMLHIHWMRDLFLSRPDQIVPVERIRFSLQNTNYIFVGLVASFGFIGVPLYMYLFFSDYFINDPIRIILTIPVGMILPAIMLAGLEGFTGDQLQMRMRPNDGIFSSVRNGITFVPIVIGFQILMVLGLVILGTPLLKGFLFWCTTLFMFSADTLLSHGGVSVFQHVFLRRQLTKDNSIPANYAHFLDFATSLILLRKVGGGYIFIHRYLLEYFARIDEEGTTTE